MVFFKYRGGARTGVGSVSTAEVAAGVAPGIATITASQSGVSGTEGLSVIGIKSLTTSPSVLSMQIGQTLQFTATAGYSDESSKDVSSSVSWSSSSNPIASVNISGLARPYPPV